jgi:hypothetical protein
MQGLSKKKENDTRSIKRQLECTSNMELSSLYKNQNIHAKLYDKAKLGPKELETLSFEDWCKGDPGQKKNQSNIF